MNDSIDPRGYFLREGLQIETCPRCGARVVSLQGIVVGVPAIWNFGNTYGTRHECPSPSGQ